MPKRKAACVSGEPLIKRNKRSTKPSAINSSLPSTEEFLTPPSLRRAPTLTLESEDKKDVKTSSRVLLSEETKDLITSILSLRSGATSGVSMFAPTSSTNYSRQSKSSKVDLNRSPWLSSGLSKYILRKNTIQHCSSFYMSKSVLMSGIGDAEFTAALMSLKSTLCIKHNAADTSENTGSSFQVSKSDLMSGVEENEYTAALDSLKSSIPSFLKSTSSLKAPKITAATLVKMKSRDSVSTKSPIKTSKPLASNSDISSSNRSSQDKHTEPDNGKRLKENIVSSNSMVLYGDDYLEVVIAIDISDDGLLPCIDHICSKLDIMYQQLKTDIPGIRFGYIIAGGTSEAMRWMDFGASVAEVREFLESVKTGDTCNTQRCGPHDMLRRIQQCFTWTEDSRRVIILMNSLCDQTLGVETVEEECVALKDMNVKIYSVHVGIKLEVTRFNADISRLTDGISVSNILIPCIYDTICMICLRETNMYSLNAYCSRMVPSLCLMRAWQQLRAEDSSTPFFPVTLSNIIDKQTNAQTTKKDNNGSAAKENKRSTAKYKKESAAKYHKGSAVKGKKGSATKVKKRSAAKYKKESSAKYNKGSAAKDNKGFAAENNKESGAKDKMGSAAKNQKGSAADNKTIHDHFTRSKNKKKLGTKIEVQNKLNQVIIPSGKKKYSLRNQTPKVMKNKRK